MLGKTLTVVVLLSITVLAAEERGKREFLPLSYNYIKDQYDEAYDSRPRKYLSLNGLLKNSGTFIFETI